MKERSDDAPKGPSTTNEPTAAQVEAMDAELHGKINDFGFLADGNRRRLAEWILRSRAEREGPLVEALDKAIECAKWQYEMRTKEAPDAPPGSLFGDLDAALARYRALDAKPEPTLLDIVDTLLAHDTGNRAEYISRLLPVARTALTLAADLERVERERDEAREIIGEYLNPICEAFERVQKIERHPPGSGISDPDYPGPTNDEIEGYDDELMSARNDLTEAIQVACDAQEEQ